MNVLRRPVPSRPNNVGPASAAGTVHVSRWPDAHRSSQGSAAVPLLASITGVPVADIDGMADIGPDAAPAAKAVHIIAAMSATTQTVALSSRRAAPEAGGAGTHEP